MHAAPAAERTALAVDIDRPFQPVLAAWLAARAYRVCFMARDEACGTPLRADLVVCELAEPKRDGAQTLRRLAQRHPHAVLVALSPRFAAARGAALARQLGVQAALAQPCSGYDFHAALDAAAMPAPPARPHDDPRPPRPGR